MVSAIKISDVKELYTIAPILVREDTSVKAVVKMLIKNPLNRVAYVIDSKNHLIGTISLASIMKKIIPAEFPSATFPVGDMFLLYNYLAKNAGAMMSKLTENYVTAEDVLLTAFQKMREYALTQLPILNEKFEILGILYIEHIMKAWYQKAYGPKKD